MENKYEQERCVLTNVLNSEMNILKRHVYILKTVMDSEPIGIIKLAELTKHPQHMVRYSLRVLEQEGLIEPSPRGAVTTDKVSQTMSVLTRILDNMNNTINDIKKALVLK